MMAASHSSFAFGAADDATVRCLTFADSRPQLHIDGRHFGIMLFQLRETPDCWEGPVDLSDYWMEGVPKKTLHAAARAVLRLPRHVVMRNTNAEVARAAGVGLHPSTSQ